MSEQAPATSRDTIEDWVAKQVAGYLNVPVEQIDRGTRLAEYGLDSVYVLSLCGDIEDEFGMPVDPTVARDHPTIVALGAYLAGLGVTAATPK